MSTAELIRGCLAGNRKACEKFHFYHYLLPRLEHLFRNMTGVPNLISPVPSPKEGLSDVVSSFVAQQEIIQTVVSGDPHPEPSIPISIRMKSTIGFRNLLENHLKTLDSEIQRLEKECKQSEMAYNPN